MKAASLAYIALFAMAACTQASMVTTTTAPPSTPTRVSYAAGSSANTTAAFDGTYNLASVQNMSKGNTVTGTAANLSNCPNYNASPLVISNGLAEFDVLYLRFQGYVTPQGSLEMRTDQGQHFSGQINQGVIAGRASGACAYKVSWQKST